MKIVQSNYIYKDPLYTTKMKYETNETNLFYSSLLSYITLKKYYGSVKFFTNGHGYNKIFKYIPYDEVEIVALPNKILEHNINAFWFYIKMIALKRTKGTVIHVDNDVMIFSNLFNKFIADKNAHILAQEVEADALWKGYEYVFSVHGKKLKTKLSHAYIAQESINCGVLGFKTDKIKNEYLNKVEQLVDFFIDNDYLNTEKFSNVLQSMYPIIIEQCNLNDVVLKSDYNVKLILNSKTQKLKSHEANIIKYTHLWSKHKFDPYIINMIKRKIKRDFPEYYTYVTTFEAANTVL